MSREMEQKTWRGHEPVSAFVVTRLSVFVRKAAPSALQTPSHSPDPWFMWEELWAIRRRES